MTARERFEQWFPPTMNLREQRCAWEAWQAAERVTADRCAVICETRNVSNLDLSIKRGPFTIQDDATRSCGNNLAKIIRAEFREE